MKDVFIVDAVRTPVGRYGGALSGTRPDDLAAVVLSSLLVRNLDLDPVDIDDVVFGNANGAGEENRNVARMALLLAGFPTSVPGVTVNRLCGSGMEAVLGAVRSIATGDASCCIAGGVESMSRAPFVLPSPDRAFPVANATLYSSTIGWRMVNPAMPGEWVVSLGEGAEIIADRYGITREAQDDFSLASHRKADIAWAAGLFKNEIVGVPGVELERDESIRADTTIELLGSLRPAFRVDGTVTAGNSSPLNDCAAALLLCDEATLSHLRREPLARVCGRSVVGLEPHLYGIGPVEAAQKALERSGIGWSNLSAMELNEAFAAQALSCLQEWPELNRGIVNELGGAIAIGHPLGCSGARLLTTLAWQLERKHGYGMAAMCIGVGQGIAVVLEACRS